MWRRSGHRVGRPRNWYGRRGLGKGWQETAFSNISGEYGASSILEGCSNATGGLSGCLNGGHGHVCVLVFVIWCFRCLVVGFFFDRLV